jgi:GAF domain-containing protein/anti-sigma regulatory factor (Ser/Thr protein kinase)
VCVILVAELVAPFTSFALIRRGRDASWTVAEWRELCDGSSRRRTVFRPYILPNQIYGQSIELARGFSCCIFAPASIFSFNITCPAGRLARRTKCSLGTTPVMPLQAVNISPSDMVSTVTVFIRAARSATTVQEVFDAACRAVWDMVADCCVTLWMYDEKKRVACRAFSSPNLNGRHTHFESCVREGHDIVEFFHKKDFENDSGFVASRHLGVTACQESRGMAFLRLQTFDGLSLLVSACVPEGLRSASFVFHRECFRLLGQGLVHAIERIRLTNERELLSRIAKVAVKGASREVFFQQVAKHIAGAFHSLGCSIFVYDQYRDLLVLGGTTGLFHRDGEFGSETREYTYSELNALTYKRGDGITGWVFETKEIVRLFDANDKAEAASTSPPIHPLFKSAEYPSKNGEPRPCLAAPIFIDASKKEGFVGVIRLHGKQANTCYLPSDERKLRDVSEELAHAIVHWYTEIDIRECLQSHEEILDRLSPQLKASNCFRSSLQVIADQTKRLLKGCASTILLKVPGKDELEIAFDSSDRVRLPKPNIRIPFSKGICGQCATTRETVVEPDVRSQGSRFYDMSDLQVGLLNDVRSEACSPILYRGELLGVLNVDSNEKDGFKIGDTRVRLLERLASQAAFLITSSFDTGTFLSAQAMLHHFLGHLGNLSAQVSTIGHPSISDPQIGSDVKRVKESIATSTLFWSQIQQGQIIKRPLNRRASESVCINDYIQSICPLLEQGSKEVEFTYEMAPDLDGACGSIAVDTLQLLFVLSNLISNAIDASLPKGKIVVKTELDVHNEQVVISVRDYGGGIAPTDMNRIYNESFTTKGGGHGGGGLILVCELVANLGGVVLPVLSIEGEGTVFAFSFPCPKPFLESE